MLFVTALYSIDTDPSLEPVAAIYLGCDRHIFASELASTTAAGRFMTSMELGGEEAISANRRYEAMINHLMDHDEDLDLESTEAGRAYIQARSDLHAFLTGL